MRSTLFCVRLWLLLSVPVVVRSGTNVVFELKDVPVAILDMVDAK
jgi:hypothetical protein